MKLYISYSVAVYLLVSITLLEVKTMYITFKIPFLKKIIIIIK